MPHSVLSVPGIPPALSKSVIVGRADGSNFIICGILKLNSSKSSSVKSIPAVFAIASRCKIEFVLPPSAKSTTTAFLIESFVTISLGLISFLTKSTAKNPESKAILLFLEDTAAAEAQPVMLIPITSVKHARVFAVYSPWHAPAVGHA